jgi:hypothetical protein
MAVIQPDFLFVKNAQKTGAEFYIEKIIIWLFSIDFG